MLGLSAVEIKPVEKVPYECGLWKGLCRFAKLRLLKCKFLGGTLPLELQIDLCFKIRHLENTALRENVHLCC